MLLPGLFEDWARRVREPTTCQQDDLEQAHSQTNLVLHAIFP